MSISLSFTLNILTVTDLVGITLTALDFLGLTPRLEATFGKLRQYSERYSGYKWERAKRNWPPHKHTKAISLEIIDGLPGVLLTLGLVVWLTGSYEGLRGFIVGLQPFVLALTLVGFAIGIIANALFAQHVIGRLFWITSWSIEKGFMILGLPPKGVTGTIGLIVSLLSFTLTHIVELSA